MTEASPILQAAPWIVLAPFIAGILIILGFRYSKTLSMLVSVGAVAYGFVHALCIFNILRLNPIPFQQNWDWFVSATFKLSTGVLIDNLAAIMLIVVTVISLLVQIYTHGYMREDPGYCRFYAYLSLFTGSMLGLVVSTNLFQMYVFWELVGVCSYLLIGFWWYKQSAAEASLKAFVVNRVGDFGFLVGILFFFAATFGFWQTHADHGILMFYDPAGIDIAGAISWALTSASASTQVSLTPALLTIISVLMFMGPMAKSAQAPLHVWLPDAMEGPTPISALIHAATMVAAGVYMVARAYPIWLDWANPLDPSTHSIGLAVVTWVGGFTAFMSATIALSQFDIKRTLAWSTVSQLGYMFVGLGTGAFTGGMFHLFNHAFFKAMLFLVSGAVIHGLHGEQDMRNMGGLLSKMRISALCFLIGAISISGVPGFSGFFSKDEIITSAFKYKGFGHEILGPLMLLTAFLTAFYMFRMFFLIFSGSYRGSAKPHGEKLTVMTMPLLVLAVPAVLSGYLGANFQAFAELFSANPKGYETPFSQFLHYGKHAHVEPLDASIMISSIIVSLGGIWLAWSVYKAKIFALNNWITNTMPGLYRFSFHKWYFDELYLALVQKILLPCYQITWQFIDKNIIDSIVNESKRITLALGEILKYSENGRGQYYALIIFACVAGISLFVYFEPFYLLRLLLGNVPGT